MNTALINDARLYRALNQLAGIKSADIVVPVKRVGVVTESRLRVVATHRQIIAYLGLRLPKGNRETSNVVSKISP